MTKQTSHPWFPAFVALAFWSIPAGAELAIPNTPLFQSTSGVKPNFIMTLDDSGSMQWAYVPDNRSGDSNTNRFKSYSYNGMYYNPNVHYYPPPKYNGRDCTLGSDNPATCYPNVSYTGAPINGFDTSRGSVDLSTNYRAVKSYSPSNTSQTFAGSPSGSSDRSYYSSTATGASTAIVKVCRVKFNSRNGEERIEIQSCPGTEDIFTRDDDGEALTVSCLWSDGCSGVPSKYLTPVDGNGDPIPYTINYYSSNSTSDKIQVGQQAWGNDDTFDNIRLEWSRSSSSSSTVYPGYYYLFYSEAGVTRPSGCTTTASAQKTDDDCYVRIWVGDTNDGYRNPDGSTATAAQKKQNFANWYAYYRTRNLSLVSGTMHALTGLDGDSRVAWQALNTCNSFSASSCKGWDGNAPTVDNRVRRLDQSLSNNKTHRQELYEWLARFPASSGTPLRTAAQRAGQYCDTTVTPLSSSSPWAEDPPTTAGTYYSCRRSVQLLMTDGIWNSDSISSYGNKTNASVTLPSGAKRSDGVAITTWTPGHPYTDGNSDDLADIAMDYWSRDLAPTLANDLPPLYSDYTGNALNHWNNARNDPANWQHLNTYGISLGLGSVLVSPNPEWGGDTYSGDYAGLVAGTKSWPSTGTNVSPGNAYDLWHASLVGRGQFYSAESADELKRAFTSVVDTVSSIASAGGGAGLSATSSHADDGTAVFRATFDAAWNGTLQALAVDEGGNLGATLWEAGQMIPASADRNVQTIRAGSGEAFTTASCGSNTALAAVLDTNPTTGASDGLCTQRLAWLRGFLTVTGATWSSSTNTATYTVPQHGLATGDTVVITGVEAQLGTDPSSLYNGTFSITRLDANRFSVSMSTDPGTFVASTTPGRTRYAGFRARSSVLGDIVDSTPVYVKGPRRDYGGDNIAVAGKTTFSSYATGIESRSPVVYVGANDGMLHAFHAPACDADAATANIPDCAGLNAGRELFAYVPSGVYANLNQLPSPNYQHRYYVNASPTVADAYLNDGRSVSGWNTVLLGGLGQGGKSLFALDVTNPDSFSAGNVKWEFSHTNLGLTMGQPQIGATTASQWAAIFGNGYNSTNDRAYLYIVDLATGYQASGSPVAAGSLTGNGLSTPYLFDSNGDGIVDAAYAGDLRGNLWKFVNTSGTWSLGNGGNALFTTQSYQPITTQPIVKVIDGRKMIYFGTGSYIATGDLTDSHKQSFYAVWDNDATGPSLTTSNLQQQTFTTSGGQRTSTGTETDYTSKRGWYMDFPAASGSPSERVLAPAFVIAFVTLEPRVIFATSTPSSDPCAPGGTSQLMMLNAKNGAQLGKVLDTNNDGIVDESDAAVAGIKLPDSVGIVKSGVLWINDTVSAGDVSGSDNASDSGMAFIKLQGTGGIFEIGTTTDPSTPPPPGGTTPHRIYWQQIL